MKSLPGSLLIAVAIGSAAFCLNAQAQTKGLALVRHAPTLNGSVDGSVQQMLGEAVTLNGGAAVACDLLVPGTPTVRLNGHPAYAGTLDGTGSTSPSNYQITLNGNSSLRNVIRRTDAVALPIVKAPPLPTGTRSVNINSAGQSPGDFATLRHLTLNGNVGQFAVPPGTYGDFTANGGSGFTLGVAGATQPAVYNFQHLTLNGQTQIQLVGPVVIVLANGFAANGTLGSPATPSRLTLNVYSGGFTLNGGCNFYGYVNAPNSTVIVNGNSQLIGGVTCDRLTVNGNGLLKLTVANQPPMVALTAPAAGAVLTALSPVTLQAAASDPDGTIAKVEFFNGATKLGETATPTSTSTYNLSLPSGFPSGNLTLAVRATDNLGAVTTSSAVAVTVNATPTVVLSAPQDGAIFRAPATIALQATASDADGSIAKVEFFQGTVKLGDGTPATGQPSTFTLPITFAAGAYTLTAKATDNVGASTSSIAVVIAVDAPPAVTLTAPTNNAVLLADTPLILTATATDADGTIAKVEFYDSAVKLGETVTPAAASTYNLNLPSGFLSGNHALTARAIDNLGIATVSASVSVLVNTPPTVALTSPQNNTVVAAPGTITLTATAADSDGTVSKVEFFNGAAKLGEASSAPYQYQWTAVAAGSYSIVAKATDNLGATTVSTSIAVIVDAPPTIALTAPVDGTLFNAPATIVLTANASDGDGTIAKVEFFHGTTNLGETANAPYQFTWTNVSAGTYALSAKATDNRGTATTSAPVTVTVDTLPAVALTAPANNAVVAANTPVTITATATDADGTIAKVEFFNGTTKLDEAVAAPYQCVWSGGVPGSYSFTAKATDNLGGVTISDPITVIVDAPPTVVLTAPANNASFTAPATLTLSATASDSDGSVAKVEFFEGTTNLGDGTPTTGQPSTFTLPFTFTTSGTYTLTAKATDDVGGTTTSAAVTIQVNSSVTPPTATGASADVEQSQSVTVTLHGQDPLGAALTFQWLDQPQLGALATVSSTVDSLTVCYTAGTTAGMDALRFTVSNGQAQSSPATLRIRVLPTVPVPVGPSGTNAGTIFDAKTKQPLEGVLVKVRDETGASLTSANGSYVATASNFNGDVTKIAYIAYSAPGYITSYRKVVAYAGTMVPVEPVYLKKRDAKTTVIGPAGGTATSAAGDVIVEIPADATGQTLSVQLTNFDAVHELPGFLPQSSQFTYAVDLSPDGATFSVPVTVKIANTLGFAPGTPVPVGWFNPDTVRWEPECTNAVISADGQWVVLSVRHFSSRDCNFPELMSDGTPRFPFMPSVPKSTVAQQRGRDPGVGISDGTYETEIDLPGVNLLNGPQALKLVYESEQASGQKLISNTVFNDMLVKSPLAREVRVLFGSKQAQATYRGEGSAAYGQFHLDQVIDLSDLPTGLYRNKIQVTNLYPGQYASTPVFGGSPVASLGVDTRQPVRYSASYEQWALWVNRRQSEFGAGWSMAGLDRLYFSADKAQAMISEGDGGVAQYQLTGLAFKGATPTDTSLIITGIAESNDGELLIAHNRGIVQRKRDGTMTTILDGVQGYGRSDYGDPDPSRGGVMALTQNEAGTVYFLFYTVQAVAGSRLTQTGLYRMGPCPGDITLVTGDLGQPTELVSDRSGAFYVYDKDVGVIWKINENGEMVVFKDSLWTRGWSRVFLNYDRTGNRLAVVPQDTDRPPLILDSDGTELVQLPISSTRLASNLFTDSEGNFFALSQQQDGDYYLIRWNTQGQETSRSAPLGFTGWSVCYAVLTQTGDLFSNDRWDSNKIWQCPNWLATIAAKEYVAETRPGNKLILDDTTQCWSRIDPQGNRLQFNSDGTAALKSDRFGNTVSYTYDSNQKISALAYNPGGTVSFGYDGSGRLASITDNTGRVTRFSVNAQSDLTQVTYPDGSVRSFAYNASHNMVAKTDAAGHAMNFTVTAQGRYTQIKYADDTTTVFGSRRFVAAAASDPYVGITRDVSDPNLPAPVPADLPDTITDQAGAKSQWLYDSRGYLLSRVGAAGDSEVISYNGYGLPYERIDGLLNPTDFEYDQLGNLTSVTRLDSDYNALSTTSIVYAGPFSQMSQSTDPNGNVTKYAYDAKGALQSVTNALGKTSSFTTNSRGQVTVATDALNRTVNIAYDTSGNLTGITNPLSQTVTYTRNSAGLVTMVTDPLGRNTNYAYDAMNRITVVTDPNGGVTSFTYDANGNCTSITNPLQKITTYIYDGMDHVTKVVAADQSTVSYAYDPMGRVAAMTDPNGNTTHYTYDGSGRLTGSTDPLGRTTSYILDGNGNVLKSTDALGRTTSYTYDALNRVIEVAAPDGGLTDYQYDPAGNMLALTDPLLHTTMWTYDALNRKAQETNPLGLLRKFSYDAAGQLQDETNRRGQVIRYTYDLAGRRTGMDLGSSMVSWSYDAAGEMLSGVTTAGTVQLAYDNLGRPTTVAQPAGTLSYVFDAVGNCTQMTDRVGTTRYAYDDLNRLTTLTDPTNRAYDFVYDAGSRLTALGYPNGTIATYAYDAASQLLAVTHQKGNAVLAQAGYTYDQVGNRTAEAREGGIARSFGYDPNDRVLSVQSSTPAVVPTEAFAYDQAGNWMTDQRNHNAANALTDDILYTYTYDEDGNLIEKRSKLDLNDVTTYSWDALNRLTKVRTTTTEMAFDYDAFGRRAVRTETPLSGGSVKTTRFVYDGANVRLEVDGDGALLAANTHAGLDRLLGRNDYAAGANYYVHADGLGSTVALTDAAGQIVERYAYSAFGQLQVLAPDYSLLATAPKVPYTYTGRDWEPKIGLYNYRARYYSPTMGRFISTDPIGFGAGDVNIYGYVGNNPSNFVDPQGLEGNAPNSVSLAEQTAAAGSNKPVFSAADVAAVLKSNPSGQALLATLKNGCVVKTGDVYTIATGPNGKPTAGTPVTNLVGGYVKGTDNPAVIVVNNLLTTTGGFKGTDAQYFAIMFAHEVGEYNNWKSQMQGNSATLEVAARVTAETQAIAMGLPETQSGYRTSSGAPDAAAIARDVANNPTYSGPTHGGNYIMRNGKVVTWP